MIERNNTAKGGDRIAAQGQLISLNQAVSGGNAARVGVFHNHNGWLLRAKFRHQLKSGVRVVDIVVRQFLALMERSARHAGAVFRSEVERRLLVRVFPIAQFLLEAATKGTGIGGFNACLFQHPARDRRVIGRRARIGLGCQLLAGGKVELARMGVQLFGQGVIVRRVGNNCNTCVVFRCRTDHRRAANVDIFNERVIV